MTTQTQSHWLRCGLLTIACVVLAGCAPMHKSLNPEEQARIRDVNVHLVLPQEGFTFSAASPGVSLVLGGGLIGAMIDSAVQKSRQESMRSEIQPVLDQLLDADFRAEARGVLTQAIADFPLKIDKAEVLGIVPTKSEQDQILAVASPQDAYLQVLMHYAYNFNSRVFTTRSAVKLWRKEQNEPLLLGSYIYQGEPLPTDAAALLPAMRVQMREAVTSTVRLAALDIRQPFTATNATRQAFMFTGATGAPQSLQGEVLAADDRRWFMRTAEGALFAVAR